MLEELRSLSEGNKKRVLVIGTAIIMIIIIGAWAIYFNSIIVGTPAVSPAAQTVTAPAAAAPTPSTTPTSAGGLGLWQNIENGFGAIINIFRNPSEYTIQPQSN